MGEVASEAAETVCRAETTRTPSGTISSVCWAAEPCHTPSIRVALPLTAAASGTLASISSCPARRAPFKLVRVSDWLRNGTLRITVSARATASAFASPANDPSPTAARARSTVSAARAASREPITTGTPARPSRRASPKPRAPEAPTIVTAPGAPERRGELLSADGTAASIRTSGALIVQALGPPMRP